jgi:hypothetical protein
MLKSPIDRPGLATTSALGHEALPSRPRPQPTLTFHGASEMGGVQGAESREGEGLVSTRAPDKQSYTPQKGAAP